MSDSREHVNELYEQPPSGRFLVDQHLPIRLSCGRRASELLAPHHRSLLARGITLLPIDAATAGDLDASILVVDILDMQGSERDYLLKAIRSTLPAGPIMLGGTDDRAVLLQAINEWHAFRLLPRTSSLDEILDAVTRAQALLELDTAVERCAHHLLVKCQTLAARVEELNTTQERLLHAERLATLGRTIGALMPLMHEQAERLEGFRYALSQQLAAKAEPTEGSARLTELVLNLGEAQRCFAALVEDMLALAEDRPTGLNFENQELDPFVERTLRLFRYDPLAQERRIHSAIRSDARVRADRDRLRHVILNLLRNAAQATDANDVIYVRTRTDGHEAVIEIQDYGAGMTPDTLKHIFASFFTTKGVSGMGLGLYLSRATVESHGGTLDCTSSPKQGSTFFVRLPVLG